MARCSPISRSSQRRVALYARVSTEMQAEEGFSIDAQLAEMRQEAQRRGWQVVAEYVDAGVSGRTLNCSQFQAMMAAAETHAFDIIMVHDLSRISRSLFDTIDFLSRLDALNIDFISVREREFDLTTPHGRLVIHILALLNQYYLDQLRMHTTKSKRHRARIGLYNASTPPLGYRHVGDEKTPPEIVPEEVEIVRLAFHLYATGKYSDDQIARILNERGFRTRTNRRFSKDSVREMLTNPFLSMQKPGGALALRVVAPGDLSNTNPKLDCATRFARRIKHQLPGGSNACFCAFGGGPPARCRPVRPHCYY